MKVFLFAFAVLSLLALYACGGDAPDNTDSTDGAASDTVSYEPESAEVSDSSETEEDMRMYFTIGDRKLNVELADNAAVDSLIEKVKNSPIVIDMSDYGGWEKVGSFGFSLPTSNEQITTQPCDFVLYQGNQLVIFYGTNSWSYTRLGKIVGVTPEELKTILGEGNITVTLSSDC